MISQLFISDLRTLWLLILVVIGADSVTPPPYGRDSLVPMNPLGSGEMEDMEFRVAIDAGKIDCFYQEAKKDHSLEISYQVIEISSRFSWLSPSGKGDLTIDFILSSPQNEILVTERRRNEGSHVHPVQDTGTFKICFDNSYSYSSKMINVEVYMYSNQDEDRWGQYYQDHYTYAPEIQAAEAIESIRTSINKVRDNLIQVVHSQDERRAIERRDRNLIEQNFEYINRFSLCSIFVFFVIAFMQLIIIRSMFDSQSFLKKLLEKYLKSG